MDFKKFLITSFSEGGHAYIFKGKICDKKIAIKCIKPNDVDGKIYVERHILTQLNHPNVIKGEFYDIYHSNFTIIINKIKRFVIGMNQEIKYCVLNCKFMFVMKQYSYNLFHWLQHFTPKSRDFFDKFRKIIQAVIRGLTYLHQNNIIHYDLHSGNILLDDCDNVVICDFNSSKFYSYKEIQNYTSVNIKLLNPFMCKIDNCYHYVDYKFDYFGLLHVLMQGIILIKIFKNFNFELEKFEDYKKYIDDCLTNEVSQLIQFYITELGCEELLNDYLDLMKKLFRGISADELWQHPFINLGNLPIVEFNWNQTIENKLNYFEIKLISEMLNKNYMTYPIIIRAVQLYQSFNCINLDLLQQCIIMSFYITEECCSSVSSVLNPNANLRQETCNQKPICVESTNCTTNYPLFMFRKNLDLKYEEKIFYRGLMESVTEIIETAPNILNKIDLEILYKKIFEKLIDHSNKTIQQLANEIILEL